MAESSIIAPPPIQVEVSEDRLRVTISTAPGVTSCPVTAVRAALEAARIPVSKSLDERLAALARPDGTIACQEKVEIATGTAAVDDTAAAVVLPEVQTTNEKQGVDHYSRCGLRIVAAGQTFGRAVAYAKGHDGVNVFGKAIPHKAEICNKVGVGKNATLGPDGESLLAGVSGVVQVEGLKVWIEPRLAVDHDVDFSTGNINFAGDITVGRNVLDLFHVQATGAITILGLVEAATIEGGGNLTVHGGIAGKEKGRCMVGGDVTAKFISNAHIEAGGNVTARKEINNARIICQGMLTVEDGPITGGHTSARGGVTCETLGSASAVRTLVEVAIDEGLRRFAEQEWPQIEAQRKVILRIRQEIAPLMKRAKSLDAQQKEKITEMLYNASTQEEEIEKKLACWRERTTQMTAHRDAAISVKERIYPGVVLHIREFEAVISKEVPGPVKIVARRLPDGWRIVAVNMLTATVTELGKHIYTDAAMEKAHALLKPPEPKLTQ